MKHLVCSLLVFILIACILMGCSPQQDGDFSKQESLSDGQKHLTADKYASILNNQQSDDESSQEENDTSYAGTVVIDEKTCEIYVVTLPNGRQETLAVDEDGNWYLKQNGEKYVPVKLQPDGSIFVGTSEEKNLQADEVAKQIAQDILSEKECTIKQDGNGMIHGQSCVFYTIMNAGKNCGSLANAAQEDGSWYYQADEETPYRYVMNEENRWWLGKPASEDMVAVTWALKQIVKKDAEVVTDSVVSINNVNCTKYLYKDGEILLGSLMVSVNGDWYFSTQNKEFSEVQFTKDGIVY